MYFWVKEKVDGKEAITKHLSTDKMYVNVMTKPVQGQQFIRERNALTNWYWIIIAEFIFILLPRPWSYASVLGGCWNNIIQVWDIN